MMEGVLPIDKPIGLTSSAMVYQLRKVCRIQKIGHAGTLDPFACGLLLLLIGRNYTKRSFSLCHQEKQYITRIRLGQTTDTYDCKGRIVSCNDDIQPTEHEVFSVLEQFQGCWEQIPPMFSAKKKGGKKLYELARKGIEIERDPVAVKTQISCLGYRYPYLDLNVICSPGTYIRSLGHEIGKRLRCGGHLTFLQRKQNGAFTLQHCFSGKLLFSLPFQQSRRTLPLFLHQSEVKS